MAAALLLLIIGIPGEALADPLPWAMGAAKIDTTPPAFDAAQDLQDFSEADPARATVCSRVI